MGEQRPRWGQLHLDCLVLQPPACSSYSSPRTHLPVCFGPDKTTGSPVTVRKARLLASKVLSPRVSVPASTVLNCGAGELGGLSCSGGVMSFTPFSAMSEHYCCSLQLLEIKRRQLGSAPAAGSWSSCQPLLRSKHRQAPVQQTGTSRKLAQVAAPPQAHPVASLFPYYHLSPVTDTRNPKSDLIQSLAAAWIWQQPRISRLLLCSVVLPGLSAELPQGYQNQNLGVGPAGSWLV